MKRLAVVTTLTVSLAGAGTATGVKYTRSSCHKLFTIKMGERAANRIYGQEHKMTLHQLRVLGYIERCLRNREAQGFLRSYDHMRARKWKQRHVFHRTLAATDCQQVASWYNDAGNTASGSHSYYGVANKTLAFGTQVTFSYHGRSITATVDDRGPYYGDRVWDLNQNTAAALRFSGVDTVASSICG